MDKLLKGFESICIQSVDIGKFYYVIMLLSKPSEPIQDINVCLYDLSINYMKSLDINRVVIDLNTKNITCLKYIDDKLIRIPLDIQPYETIADYMFSVEGIKTMLQPFRFSYDPFRFHFLKNKSIRLAIGIDEIYEDNDLIGEMQN